MVERWWGRRGVYARDFADLVRPASGGILTTDLVSATRARGWDAVVYQGTPDLVKRSLRDGVPVVALVQVGRDRYHYVVMLGWSDGHVVFHDPATAPFSSIDEESFLARWTGADRWALVVRPAAPTVTPSVDSTIPIADSAVPIDLMMPCPPWLDRALAAAAANRLDDASALLKQAGEACPMEPLVLRETAGVRFKQGHHAEVIRLVSSYLALVPGDEYAWRLLATSRYLAGDRDGALEAWNRIGRPTVDLVRIDGVRKVRFRGIAGAMSVPPGTLLTPSRLAFARRRISDVPALRRAAVDYQPVAGGIVEVRATVVERPRVDPIWRLAMAGVIRAVAQNQAGIEIASPTGGGELWTANWRWDSVRPRAVFRVDMPADPGVPGVIAIEGDWERFRFAPEAVGAPVFEETRRSAVVGFGAWVTPGVRPTAALRLERWSGNRRYLAASIGAEFRARDDRFEVSARTEYAFAFRPQASYSGGGIRAAWASSLGLGRAAWSVRLGSDWAGRKAPIGTWPVVGADLSWALPLRAHTPDNGVPAGRSVGRSIISAGIAGDHPVYRKGPLVFAVGLFLDAARILVPADRSPNRFYLDGGAGLRIGIADGQTGVLHIDLARSLVADRAAALTLGIQRNWPMLQPRRR